MDYLTPNKTTSKLYKEYSEAADGSISPQDFTTFHYTKVGTLIRETIDKATATDYITYQKSGSSIEVKEYKNNILTKTTSRPAKLDINDLFFTDVDDDGDSFSCNYGEKLASFTTAYKIFSDVIKLDCIINSSKKVSLYLAKNMGFIHSEMMNKKGEMYKNTYIGEPQHSLNTVAKYSTSYARSVAIADNGNTVFLGDTDGLVTLDLSNLNNVAKLSSINSGKFMQIKLSSNESLLYAVDGNNFLIIDISNRSDIQIISSMQMRGADSFSLSSNEAIAVIQDLDVTRIVDVSDKSNIITLFDLKSGKSALANDGKTLFYISPDLPKDIAVYDISDPSNPFVSSIHHNLPYNYPEILLSHSGNELFVSEQQNITIFDVISPNNMNQLSSYSGGHIETMQSKLSLSPDDKTLFITSEEILQLLDISDLNNIHTVSARNDFWDIGAVASYGNKLFIADGINGLQVLQK
jgi:hypothetical protein